jgi:tetratricopeptide (TPR) repeat protein
MSPRPSRLQLRRLAALAALAAGCATGGPAVQPSGDAAAAAPGTAGKAAAARASAPAEAAPSPRGQRLFEEAVASLEEQKKLKIPTDWELLERKWRSAAVEDVPEAWFDVGVALERQGKAAEARGAYERALALRPAFREAAVNLALLEASGADPRDAARRWAEVLKRFPDDAPLRVRLAALYREAGQLDEAWRLAREALQRDPAVRGAYPVMMRVALERGQLDLAELVAVRARKLDPDDPEIAYLLGSVQERRGDEAAALAQYRRAVARHPEHLPSRYRLLELMVAARSWEGAAEQARAILQRNPGDARVHLALGIALRNLGKVDEALAEYERADALAGGRLPELMLARGAAYARGKGECAPALAWLEKYEVAVGPAVATESPSPALRRECTAQLASARQAEEAARAMQEEAARKAAAARPAPGAASPASAVPPVAPGPSAAAPPGAPSPSPATPAGAAAPAARPPPSAAEPPSPAAPQ